MRVLYISHGNIPSTWAHSVQAMKMADALAAQVGSLKLLTAGTVLRSPVHDIDLGEWYGVGSRFRVVRLPVHWQMHQPCFSRVTNPRFDRAAGWYARLSSPDLVYARSMGAAYRCIKQGLKTLVEVHGSPKASAFHEHAFEQLSRVASRPSLLGLVTVTDYLGEQYVQLGFPKSKILVWPDAVDPVAFERTPDRRQVRKRLGLPEDASIAVYCGHFREEKGVPCLVDAARQAPEVTFCLVGGTPRDIAAMRQRAAGCPNVRFAGFVPNRRVPEYLAAADLVVLPNSARFDHARATSPLKLFEYMAARRPIVATAIPALDPLLRDGDNALVVEADSPEALASAVKTLVADASLASRLAARARTDVEPFTWERRAREILERFTQPFGAADRR